MKNIQIIDGADNCTYDIFEVNDSDFIKIFPDDADIEFSSDLYIRLGQEEYKAITSRIWINRADKKNISGLHGTLFFNLDFKKKYYPTKKESEMISVF